MNRLVLHGLAIAAVLAAVAAATPTPAIDDGNTYREIGRRVLIRDCATIHCFRVLVPVVLEQLPGRSLVKWKAYAVVAIAVGAVAVGQFCLLLGVAPRAAVAATWMSAFGAGSLYSLYDCYTADPLMYMIGPLIAVAVAQDRIGAAALLGGVGVFAKEFSGAPLWIFAAAAVLERRWRAASRLLTAAGAVTLVWLSIQVALRVLLHYRHSETASADVLHGAYLAMWLRSVGTMSAVYLFTSFGALYLLFAAGLVRHRRNRILALAALPALAAFVYVQQPERALWNFHFIVIPIAVQALDVLPGWALAAFVASFGVANLRFGAQLPLRTAAHAALALSVAIAVAAIVLSRHETDRV